VKLTRRETLTLAAAATVLGAAGAPSLVLAAEGDVHDTVRLMAPAGLPDKVLGSADAPVTVIEYASPTCPHCAVFSNDVLEPFKEKYVATGQVKLILRPFARNTLDAAIFMLAEAAADAVDEGSEVAEGEFSQAAVEAYDNVLATFFRTQQSWGTSDKPLDAVRAVATQLGFSEETFQAALTDQELFSAIEAMRDQALNDFGLEGTPTFYINGKQLTGNKTLDQLSAEIDPLLA